MRPACEQIPYNLLGYPVLQAADILMPRAHLVPVGKDNESHVELTRQIARRFNNAYGEVFPIPDAYVVGGTLVGTDGQAKMSKSLDNAIFLSDDAKTVHAAGDEHVHRPQPHPRRRPRHGRGQPGLRLPRRLQPQQGRGRGPQGALSRRQGRRRRGQGEAGARRSTPSSTRCASAAPTTRRRPALWTSCSTTARCERARRQADPDRGQEGDGPDRRLEQASAAGRAAAQESRSGIGDRLRLTTRRGVSVVWHRQRG